VVSRAGAVRLGRRAAMASMLLAGLVGCGSDADPDDTGPREATTAPTTVSPTTTTLATVSPTTTTPRPTTAAPTTAHTPANTASATTIPKPTVQDVIDIGGEEAIGLAVSDKAVWAISFQAGTLTKIDPETGTVLHTTTLPSGGATVLARDGAVWTASYGGTINRIDPETGDIVTTVRAREVCCDLTTGDGALWAVDPNGQVLRVEQDQVVARWPAEMDRNAHTNAVFAGDSLWVSSDTTPLHKMNPDTGAIEDVDVGGGVPFLEHDGLLWGAAPRLIWAVDPATGRVAERLPLQRSIEVMALGFDDNDRIWAGIRRPGRVGAVLELDRATGAVLAELRDVDIPAHIEAGFGSVWVTDSGSSTVTRLAT
jgi:outer membrane protein assembly factor BamB